MWRSGLGCNPACQLGNTLNIRKMSEWVECVWYTQSSFASLHLRNNCCLFYIIYKLYYSRRLQKETKSFCFYSLYARGVDATPWNITLGIITSSPVAAVVLVVDYHYDTPSSFPLMLLHIRHDPFIRRFVACALVVGAFTDTLKRVALFSFIYF